MQATARCDEIEIGLYNHLLLCLAIVRFNRAYKECIGEKIGVIWHVLCARCFFSALCG